MSERKRKENENFELPDDFLFLFHVGGDNTFMFLEPNYKSWPRHFTTIGQLALDNGTEVLFKAIGSGIFICKGPRNLLEAVCYTIDNRIEEGSNLNHLDITQAMEKVYQTVNKFGQANKSNIIIEEPVSSGSVNNVLSDNGEIQLIIPTRPTELYVTRPSISMKTQTE